MEQCIFCQIANHESPAKIVYENDSSMIIMAKEQDVSGHLLAFSKTHATDVTSIDPENWLELQNTIKKVSDHVINDCGYAGVNLLCASGKAAGQSVNHLHFHLILRQDHDGIDAWPHLEEKNQLDRDEVYRKIKNWSNF